MAWRELRVTVDAGAVGGVSTALFGQGAAGVQEDFLPGEAPPPRQPWDTGAPPPLPKQRILVSWFEDPDEAHIVGALPPEARDAAWSPVDEQDWGESWKDGFTAVRVSDTLVLAPPWDAPDGALLIEPGQGFGTGQHPSTIGALALMEPVLPGLASCLDVGCGSGVLALLAARHGLVAHGIDVEASAVRDAQANAALNALTASFSTTPLAEVTGPSPTGRYDLVAANLHAELLVRTAPDLLRLTGSVLVCAGILADREPLVRDALDPHLHLDERLSDGSWVALRYRRQDPGTAAP